jgi:anhydro-N-acetylmuramic acid kinase
LNLGGIANITLLSDNTTGFDTGPANTLINQWIHLHKDKSYDEGGAWAASGTVNTELLNNLLADPYFSLPFPKSTGTDYFSLEWLDQHLGKIQPQAAEDVQATLLALSVASIALGIEQLQIDSGTLFVCGGGAHNSVLMKSLANKLPNIVVRKTDVLGVSSDWVEAVGFAWLGYCNLHEIPSNLPSVTGASGTTVLGERFEPES